MVWDETKQNAVDPNNPSSNEKISPDDWNDMVTDQKARLGSDTTTSDVAEGSNLYYTEARVSANTSVVANTAKVSASGSVDTHSDVDTTGKSNGQVLTYNSSSGNWEAETPSSGVTDHTLLSNIGSYTHDEIDAHIDDTDNPHVVTKEQLSLGSDDTVTFDEVSTTAVKFDTTTAPSLTPEGTLWWNGDEYTINIETGLGPVIQVGQETLMLYYNDTGSDIDNLTVLHPKSATSVGGILVPTPDIADASDWELCQGTLSVATQDILAGEIGLATRFGKARGGDTSGLTAGAQLWLSDDGSGALTETKPEFPSYAISMGGSLNSAASPNGEVFVSVTKDVTDTFGDAWDGSIRETISFTVTSDGSTITGNLENGYDDTKDITLLFSDGFYTYDTTPAATITLTAGSTTVPQTNYVYILKSTKALTVSTSGWPGLAEHIKIAQIAVLDAATTATDGALRNQNWNDHIKREEDNGHILHMAQRLRAMNAEWDNGVEASLTGTTANVYIDTTSGQVYQLHLQDFPAQDMSLGSDIHIVNHPTTPYTTTTNLNTVTTYSTGTTWNNEWTNLVIWGVANKSGEQCHLMVNLPSAGYTSEDAAIADANNYTNYTIPSAFKGVGFLIARFTVRRSSTTYTYNSGTGYLDLRGYVPNNTAGGGTGSSGISTFTGLSDTPSSYSGNAGLFVKVNSGETALEFASVSGTGDVTGPASSVDSNVVTFNGTSGKTIQDSGVAITDLFDKTSDDMDDIPDGTTYVRTTNDYTDAEQTKVGYISVTQAVDLDTMESDIATNNAKVTNATHTGDASGSTTLTLQPAAITGKTTVTALGSDYVLISDTSDSGNLKKALISDFASEGDVNGPASATDTDIAVYNGTTGKLLADSGYTIANVLNRTNHTGTQLSSTISDFQTTVSANTNVSANTAARHSAVTVLDSSEIDFTLTGQQITASLITGSIDVLKLDSGVQTSLGLADSSTQPGDNISTLTNDSGFTTNTGTVTSVAITVPTGLAVSGSPITTSGTFALTYDTGYVGYTTTEQTKLSGIETGAQVNTVDSVNSLTGTVILDSDDIAEGSVNLYLTGNEFQKTTDTLDEISDGSTYVKYSVTEQTKLSGIESGADVTDETNVTDALDGATLTDVGTPASGDLILLQDASDSNILKVAQFSTFGGSGSLPSGVQGDIVYHNGSDWVVLNAGTSGYYLQTQGSAANPQWAAVSGGSGGASMVFERKLEGAVYTTTFLPIVIPDSLAGADINEIRIALGGLPTGQAFKVQVYKNGTATTNSIFTSDVPIEIATTQTATNGIYMTGCTTSGSTVGTAGTTIDSGQNTLSADDILFVVITQVGSTVAGADFVISIDVS